MGKKARLKRLAEAKGAKQILEQIAALDKEIAANTADLVTLEGQKAEMLAGMMIENSGQQRTVSLGDLLNDSQMQAVIDILNRPNLDDIAITKLLKQYLAQYAQQFAAVGIVPDYLAYVLLANKEQLRAMARQSNNTPEDPFQPGHMSRN
jgi:hypothetical protein